MKTMALEELRESLDVGCLPNTDRPRWFAAIDAAIKQRDQGANNPLKGWIFDKVSMGARGRAVHLYAGRRQCHHRVQ